jgi:hypothetical protein
MLKYLEEKYGERATCGDKSQLQFMRSEANRLEEQVKEQREKEKAEAGDAKSEKGSEEETDEDVSSAPILFICDELPKYLNFNIFNIGRRRLCRCFARRFSEEEGQGTKNICIC